MESKPPVGFFDNLENFGMAVAERVGRPTVLEIDIALAVHIPDEIACRFVDNNLSNRTKAALPGSLHFGIKPQSILEKWNAALKCRTRLGARETVICHVLSSRSLTILSPLGDPKPSIFLATASLAFVRQGVYSYSLVARKFSSLRHLLADCYGEKKCLTNFSKKLFGDSEPSHFGTGWG